MNEGELATWQGIRDLLDLLEVQHREPDPWESHYVAEAIDSLEHGYADPGALAAAHCSIAARHEVAALVSEADWATSKADLRAAFGNLRVPGGHPA